VIATQEVMPQGAKVRTQKILKLFCGENTAAQLLYLIQQFLLLMHK
jgi:hypothetical protein